MIDITLLGTSALIPLPDRAETAAKLALGGHSILFDCGEGTQTAARKAGVSLMKTDMIALTHYHGDHTFGIPGLLQTMCRMGRTEPLYITGPAGLDRELEPLLRLASVTEFEIRLIHIGSTGIRLSDISDGWDRGARLSAFPTAHRVPSQGYCFELERTGKFNPRRAQELRISVQLWSRLQKGESVYSDGRLIQACEVLGADRRGLKFVFTGDTAFCDSVAEAAKDADLLICDATYGENAQAELAHEHGHMCFSQAAETAKRAGVRELWLSHYSQMIRDPNEYLSNATEIFENSVCGADGMAKTLRFDEDG